jgi:hypothetical protein
MASGVTARFCRCRAVFIGNLFFTASSCLLPNLMRIPSVTGKHQSIIRIRQIFNLENLSEQWGFLVLPASIGGF